MPLTYSSYYAGGIRVFSYAGGQIAEDGAFVDQGGSNFWGIEQFTTPGGVRLIAGSDRDKGLFIARYTGPGCPGAAAPPAGRARRAQTAWRSSASRRSASVPLACTGGAGRTLTYAAASKPAAGALGTPAAGAVSLHPHG